MSVRVTVDPANPGQFFACCGLLELADRLWPGAEGWFEGDEFVIEPPPAAGLTTAGLLQSLIDCEVTNTMPPAQVERLRELAALTGKDRAKIAGADEELKELMSLRRELSVVFGKPFHLVIDWFLDDHAGGSRFKTWAGQQSVLEIATAMHRATRPTPGKLNPAEACFRATAADAGLPFNFDSDLGGQATAIDVGFSADPLGVSSPARPFVELLAFVGLQRFRPGEYPGENRYSYAAWGSRLPPAVAAAVCSGGVDHRGATLFEFRLLYRTKYLKSFLPARPVTRPERGDR